MQDYESQVAYVLNRYVWDKAKGLVDGEGIKAEVWDVSSYSYRPIFPISTMSSVDMSNLPVVLYDIKIMDSPRDTFWPMYHECVTYTIVGSSQNIPQLFSLRNYFYELFKKFDESASDINSYIRSDIHLKTMRTYQRGNVYQFQQPTSKEHHNAVVLEVYTDYTKS